MEETPIARSALCITILAYYSTATKCPRPHISCAKVLQPRRCAPTRAQRAGPAKTASSRGVPAQPQPRPNTALPISPRSVMKKQRIERSARVSAPIGHEAGCGKPGVPQRELWPAARHQLPTSPSAAGASFVDKGHRRPPDASSPAR